MNRKRLGQFLIGGIISACGVLVAALIDLAAKDTEPKDGEPKQS